MKICWCNDIFKLPQGYEDAICITTNGMVKKNGHAVMGAGIALEANRRLKLSKELGLRLAENGNQVFHLGVHRDRQTGTLMRVFSFPTKHDWKDPSDINLIRTSASQLVDHCNNIGIRHCYLPCPGCANGGLDWSTQVRPILESILDDRFIIADKRIQMEDHKMNENIDRMIQAYTRTVQDLQGMTKYVTDPLRQEFLKGCIITYQGIIQDLTNVLVTNRS